MNSIISTLPGAKDLFIRTWLIYKARLRTFLGIMILPVIVGFLFLISQAVLKDLPALRIFFFIVFWLATVIIGFWSQVSLLYAIKEREQKIGIRESLRKGWHKIISFIWVSILAGFIIMGGTLLFIVPGIIFAVWFSLATYVLVSEDRKGMAALFRSKQWVSGNWWKVFWRFLIMGLIIIIVGFFPAFIVSALEIPFLKSVFGQIFTLFLTPFTFTFGFLIYEDLKRLKGEILFEPPKKGTKIKYILIGVIGVLLIPGILTPFVLTSMKGARERVKDTRIIADMIQLRATAEIIYSKEGDDYSKVDCNHPQIAFICQDIKVQTGKELIIHSSQEAYCAYVELVSGGYYCIDSSYSGAGRTSIYPGKIGYCDGLTFVCPP